MTIVDKFKPKANNGDKPRMPRGPDLQIADAAPQRYRVDDDYADEAKRVAQRHLDQVAQIEALREEADRWRHLCSLRETQIEQLQTEKAAQAAELDKHRNTLATIRAHYDIAGKILLDGLTAISSLGGDQVRAEISLAVLSAAVDKGTGDPVDQMPPLDEEANKHD